MHGTPTLATADRPYRSSVIAITLGWSLGMLCLWGMSVSGAVTFDHGLAVLIGLGSGAIALMSVLPGAATERMRLIRVLPGWVAIGVSAAAIIRLLGTVALLGLCSYHLPADKKEIAGMILVWYVYLTSIEVAVLAMLLPRRSGRTAIGN